MNEAWIELAPAEHDEVWDGFFAQFHFKPSVYPENFPGIFEPPQSITYKISEDFGNDSKVADLNSKALAALRAQTALDESVYVLDWQHQGYWFYPHRAFNEWQIPVLPNGDYYIFLAQDFRFGIFGHPWEWTSCVWGEGLLSFFDEFRPLLWEYILRKKS